MKKVFFALVAMIGLMCHQAQAQDIVDNYSFSTSIDSTAWIAGVDSTIIASPDSTVISTRSDRIDIGFTFNLGGSSFSQFSTNVNGTIRLGNGSQLISASGAFAQPLGSTRFAGRVEPFGWRGQFDSTCYTRYATMGDSGSRVTVVETRMGIYGQNSTHVTFQVQMFEATGSIRFVYGPAEGPLPQMTRQCGVVRTSFDIIFIEQENHEAFRFVTSCTQTTAAGVWPETWRCYTLEHDASPCPYPGNITVVRNNADSTVLSWPAVAGASYHLTIAEAGLNTILTDTFICIVGMLNSTTTYNGTLQTMCADGSESYRTRAFNFTTGCGTIHQMPWTDDFQLTATDNCWQKPQTASARRWRRQSTGNGYVMRVPNGGSSSVYNEWLVSPPLVLPDTVGLTLGWWYKSSQNGNDMDPQVKVRLLVCDTSDDIDTSAAWVTLCTINHYEQYFQQYYRLLDAWAGHRVRVAFQRVGQGGGYCDVDNVSVEVLTQPSVVVEAPSLVYGGDTVTVVPVLTRGVLANPQYVWHSTMEEQGLMLRTEDDDTLRCVYLGSGTDTVTLTLTTDYGTATATAVIDVVDCRTVTTFPWHEDFEHGFLCWDMPTSGSNVWDLRTTGAHGGQRVACATIHNSYNIYDTLISQPIVVPTDAHGLTLSWWMRHDASADPSGYRRIWVKALNAANPVWSSGDSLFYSTGIPTSWQQFSVDLEPLAGQTVRLTFVSSSYSYYSGKYIYIDDIEIRYTREPIISFAVSASQVYDGDTVTATATLVEGDTAGLAWWMNSRMADMGQADITGSGPQVQIAYHGTGIDTIVASATNAYGSIADTAYVRVCPVQDTLPWVANFVNELPCWQVINGACNVDNNYGYLSFTDWPTAVATLPVYVPDDGNVVVEYACAYRYFYGSTIVMVTTDMVHFDTIGNEPFTDGTHPSTRIPLGAYAGQYVRVVFKATGEFLQYYLTSVQIRYANEPVVQAEADDGYFPGTPVTLTASLMEGDTVNLTYSWASAMTQRGDATLTFDGGPQATLVPSVGGPDTVTVWATNNHGTDSTTIVVNIKPCATVDSLPWVENFSNRFSCWWQHAGSQWSPDNTGTMACVINSPTTGDNWLISRAIELPTLPSAEGEGMQLWWDAAAIYANSHTYSVWITTGDYRDTGSYVSLATYSSTLPTYNNGWNTPRVDLSAYAGQTVHLAFRYQTHYYDVSGIPGILAIDNVRILDTRPPQVAIIPPARCFVDDTVVYRANLIHGVQSGMSYTWQSTMEQQGLADVNFNDSLIYVVYHAAGSDTVSLVASNVYGSDTAWTAMTVKNCPAVTVPWYEDFEVVNPCWSGSWTPDYITYTWLDSTTHVMHSTPNSWYASPWIDLPDTTGLQLMWNKNGSAANSFMKIFVSPTGSIEPADFTDTLLYRETPNGFDSL
ncbi:MAG: choice-of-anchor J domain-containing protein, partial [Bacteroidales bacterium]|nr:choice-of-anchor J domain-containing protein [Bacteroidales bacterium]